jgi:hypothetical protein
MRAEESTAATPPKIREAACSTLSLSVPIQPRQRAVTSMTLSVAC